jgi:signal transduction histidine kinase
MGLAICRSIVESHGGRIWATRNDDRGLTVHVALPVAGVAATPSSPPASVAEALSI